MSRTREDNQRYHDTLMVDLERHVNSVADRYANPNSHMNWWVNASHVLISTAGAYGGSVIARLCNLGIIATGAFGAIGGVVSSVLMAYHQHREANNTINKAAERLALTRSTVSRGFGNNPMQEELFDQLHVSLLDTRASSKEHMVRRRNNGMMIGVAVAASNTLCHIYNVPIMKSIIAAGGTGHVANLEIGRGKTTQPQEHGQRI